MGAWTFSYGSVLRRTGAHSTRLSVQLSYAGGCEGAFNSIYSCLRTARHSIGRVYGPYGGTVRKMRMARTDLELCLLHLPHELLYYTLTLKH